MISEAEKKARKSKYNAEYRIKNGERLRANSRAKYAENPEKAKAYARAWNRNNPQKAKANKALWWERNLGHRQGLKTGEFAKLVEKQENRCAICGEPPNGAHGHRLHVDHNHKTGKVRGLLCHGCNIGLGGFRDDPERALAAAIYLADDIDKGPASL